MKSRLVSGAMAWLTVGLVGAGSAAACSSDEEPSAAGKSNGAAQAGDGGSASSTAGKSGSPQGGSENAGGTNASEPVTAGAPSAGAGGEAAEQAPPVECVLKGDGSWCECRRSAVSVPGSVPCNIESFGGANCTAYVGDDGAKCSCTRWGCQEDDESYDCYCPADSGNLSAPTSCPDAHDYYCLDKRGDCYGRREPCEAGELAVESCAFEAVSKVWAANPLAFRTTYTLSGLSDCAAQAAQLPDNSVVNGECTTNAQCASSFRCIQGACKPALGHGAACTSTAECSTSFECSLIDGKKQCFIPGRQGTACDSGRYCYRGLVCTDGKCAKPAATCNGGCGPCQYFGSDVCCYTCENGSCEQSCSF